MNVKSLEKNSLSNRVHRINEKKSMVMHIFLAKRKTTNHRNVLFSLSLPLVTFFALKAKDFRLDLDVVGCWCCRVEIFNVNWDLFDSIGFKRLPLVMIDDEDDEDDEIICSSLLIVLTLESNAERSSVVLILQNWWDVRQSVRKQLLQRTRSRAGTRQ